MIPSCGVWKIFDTYPSEDSVYVAFSESEIDSEIKCSNY